MTRTVTIDLDTLSALAEAADKWSNELSAYVIPEASDEDRANYEESQRIYDAAIAVARALYEAPQVAGPIPTGFWAQIAHQLERIRRTEASTFDEVRSILLDPIYDEIVADVNKNWERRFDTDSAFFAGSGGEHSLYSALVAAGWSTIWARASYHYAMVHDRTGEKLTYIEGDVERGEVS